ncbi:acyltransferase [Methylicorpusculum oleiharenae]|uniref:acyltransferase family protein n=1 Tax=Methylicorpusculum oleiharenae TaxID=1338687 RepID=UPI00135B2CFA|nr:acyltransferase family protein [Methylicorpusculum oleiharenae]MCD2450821.1 acyltransferase [Methylicorpusculum oleiharenae]
MIKQSLPQSTYRLDIDGLRAIAVVSVIINHFNKDLMPSGYLGVDIFYVISGYVISLSLVSRSHDGFKNFLLWFYERRIKRILPALVACVLITSVLICFLDSNPDVSLQTGIASLFGLSNIYLFNQAADYFSPSMEVNVFTQTWSLGIEEQFYFLYPVLILIAGLGRHKNGVRNLLLIVAIISIASLVGFVCIYNVNRPAAYFLLPTRLWELGAGCLLFLYSVHSAKFKILSSKGSVIILVAIIVSFFIPIQFAIFATILVVLFTMLLIGITPPSSVTYAILTLPIIVYLGRISFSLYLWHWSVLSLSRWSIGVDAKTVPFQIAVILILASGSYKYIEKPLRKAQWSTKSLQTIGYGISVSICSVFLLFILLFDHNRFIINHNALYSPPAYLPLKNNVLLNHDPICVVDGNKRLLNADTFDLCTVLPRIVDGQMIWVVGDSHSGHLQGLLYAMHDNTGIGVHLIETPGRPFPSKTDDKFEARDIIFEEIKKRMHSGDILLVARGFISTATGKVAADVSPWIDKIPVLANEMSLKGVNVVIFGPPPLFKFEDIGICKSQLLGYSSCDVDRDSISAEIEDVQQILKRVAENKSNIYIFNLFDLLCPKSNTRCSPHKNDTFIFRDRDHLNSFGSASLADSFIDFLNYNNLLKSKI